MTDDAKLLDFNPGTVRFRTWRCHECGRWWAYEQFGNASPDCPVCMGRRLDRMGDAISKLERTISALRGAVKRRSKKS